MFTPVLLQFAFLLVNLPFCSSQKNVILIITDDQDIELGSMEHMPKTLKLMKERGVEFESGFVTTPICCPSRTSILSGLYVHNHNVHTNNCNCSGIEWRCNHDSSSSHEKVKFREKHEPRALPVYMKKAGYRTSYVGKYLNEYEGEYVPPGWDYWLGLVKNSKFYNYTINWNGERIRHGSDYEADYFTDIVTNRTVEFLSSHLKLRPWQPFLSVLSYPAPHGPEDPAPHYSHLFEDVQTHRTDNWNYAPNPDKQWILQRTGKMEPVHVAFTDLLHRRRLQTLQSVDEGIHRLFSLLRDYNQLSSTYFLYTSDHGYHLGQFGLIKGKSMPYEFDIRIPYYLRGPGVPRALELRQPVSNLDILPTCLHIAGLDKPDHLDGRSLLELVKLVKEDGKASKLAAWRDTVLIERGKMPKLKKIRERFLKQKERYSKEMRLRSECSKPEWQKPCEAGQPWKCYLSSHGKWRIYKCRNRTDCDCEQKRDKRQVADQESLVDEFLMNVYKINLKRSEEWFQGNLDVTKNRRKKRNSRSCVCKNSTLHPLKMEDLLLEEDSPLYDLSYHKKGRIHQENWCGQPQMNCFTHDADHWRTPPLWPTEYGQFCFCQNSNNNTYWCLRTVNETHNTLYCEFVTNFISYYDLNDDPYQLTNKIYSLEMGELEDLSERLRLLRICNGERCEQLSRSDWKRFVERIDSTKNSFT